MSLASPSHPFPLRFQHRQVARPSPVRRLWERSLDHYPETRARYWYLSLVVLSTIILYYEFYVQSAVTPSVVSEYHMSWPFFVYIVVVGNLVGAFASLIAGLADRWGRANLVVYGLLVTGLIVLVGMPNAPNMWVYGVLYGVLGFVEGVMLVATPALVRDFSPQMGRGSAMGLWTMGPVIASLTVALVSSNTLGHLRAWQDQFVICGVAGMALFAVALFGLRELSPGLRDQLMVSIKDRQLVEARAAGIDVEESIRHPWRKIVHFDTVGSAVGIGLYLIVYYTMIAFLVAYMVTTFGYTQQRANALGNWMWAFNAGSMVVVGLLSDRLRVRKPFIVVGIAGSAVATALFALHATQAGTSYYTFVWILCLLAVFLGFTFAPWLAAFTETVEARSPALTATGLAVWGWVLRLAIAGSLFVLPYVVTSMTPLMEHGAQVQAVLAAHPAEVQTLSAVDSGTASKLLANPGDTGALGTALSEISGKLHVSSSEALTRLVAVSKLPAADLRTLSAYGTKVSNALAASPKEWQRWWWVSFGTELMLFPFVFVMKGRWSPRRARREEEEHERMVQAEIAAMAA